MDTDPFEEIDDLLRKAASELPRRPDWATDFDKLSTASSDDERLAVYQAVRDDGCFHMDVGKFMVCFLADAIVTRLDDAGGDSLPERAVRLDAACHQGLLESGKSRLLPRLSSSDARHPFFDAMRRELGDPGPIPVEQVGAIDAWRSRLLKQLQSFGEDEIADQVWRHPLFFYRDMVHGEWRFFDPSPESALRRAAAQTLFHKVCACVRSEWDESELAPFRRHWYDEGNYISMDIYPTPIELVGGPADGALVDSDQVSFDLVSIGNIFNPLRRLVWEVADRDRHGEILVEGDFERYEVELSLIPLAPYGEKPVLQKDSGSYFNPLRCLGVDDADLKFDDLQD